VSDEPPRGASLWSDAALAAALLAVDPTGLGGVALRALPGPVRDRWLGLLRELLPGCAPVRRAPLHVDAGRLLGGLDLATTLRAGRAVVHRGLLAEADGGVLLLAMAERQEPSIAAQITAVLDTGEVRLERDGLGRVLPTRFAVVALDEGLGDERPPAALRDRLACHVDLGRIGVRDALAPSHGPDAVEAARARLPAIEADQACSAVLCAAGLRLGIASLRAPLLALRVARAAAALSGHREVSQEELLTAARLVLAPRAMILPAPDDGSQPVEPPDANDRHEDAASGDRPLEDRVVAVAQAAMPETLLAQLRLDRARGLAASKGRAGALGHAARRGRPLAPRPGAPRAGGRLDLVATLRAAAPWQPLRRSSSEARVAVRPDDFRIRRFKQRTRTTTIFAVDASGSSALHRLAEAKGAVELVLAECYVRRDQVALLAFRGAEAELLLPPTRSLVRARRCLAGLPGGGGTPLATGIDAAAAVADAVLRRGDTPVVLLLTDGCANVARDGTGGRARAVEDAVAAARRLRAERLSVILVDTSPRPQAAAERLAAEMQALYLPLPYADAEILSRAVHAAT
jgi:magnesium chelatase subunit D